ncbi:hypothetical protein VIGAN_04369300 [Vigna angularis var. angularis]|uniref:Signal peptidase complex subunit 3 n=1 Tax=Vigna angularis var. angularis TaxID=157739 RepID=A0A0S3RZR9_PHAAN|nr:hypothetical protein VIGAN_04369300 [Vigna angularis var. angularis]
MHSLGYRANALLTFAVTILALMCGMASLSDNFNSPSPSAQVQVLNINWFQKQPNANDEISMTLNISADLQSLFTWNTKQVIPFNFDFSFKVLCLYSICLSKVRRLFLVGGARMKIYNVFMPCHIINFAHVLVEFILERLPLSVRVFRESETLFLQLDPYEMSVCFLFYASQHSAYLNV